MPGPAAPVLMVKVDDADAPRATLAGANDATGPRGATLAARLTVPVRSFRLLMAKEEVPEAPASIVSVAGLEDMAKSTTLTVTVDECVIELPEAITVTA